MNQTEKDAFLAVLAADRYDQTTRLVFADFLDEQGLDDEAQVQRQWTPEKQRAEDWLRDFAGSLGGTSRNYGERDADGNWIEPDHAPITYEDVLEAGKAWVESDGNDYFVQMGTEHARSLMYEPGVREKFWQAWQTVTGQRVEEEQQGTVFGCSC